MKAQTEESDDSLLWRVTTSAQKTSQTYTEVERPVTQQNEKWTELVEDSLYETSKKEQNTEQGLTIVL